MAVEESVPRVEQGLIRESLRSFLTPSGRAEARPKYCAALCALRFAFCRTSFGSNPSGSNILVYCSFFWSDFDFVYYLVVARPEGFEPPTLWFVAKYSIQLSYGRFDWRRERDSNPRWDFSHTPLAGERLRPLGHLSNQWLRSISGIWWSSIIIALLFGKILLIELNFIFMVNKRSETLENITCFILLIKFSLKFPKLKECCYPLCLYLILLQIQLILRFKRIL